ncbi:hypothetical protein B0H11DRAFT_15328 [Mycena galericulata]|nr:hypothetical protein B0H11DRAFT_15328 [Mycena galericulata]
MFSKVLALGLGALALVRAAPSFQMPMISCRVNVQTSVAAADNSFDVLPPGTYSISNNAFEGVQLRSYGKDEPIFVSLTREFPGPFGLWRVEQSGNGNEYKITNVGLNAPTYISDKNLIYTGSKSDSFSIEPAGDGLFTIRVPNQDKVWSLDGNPVRANVQLRGQDGNRDQVWRFMRVNLD